MLQGLGSTQGCRMLTPTYVWQWVHMAASRGAAVAAQHTWGQGLVRAAISVLRQVPWAARRCGKQVSQHSQQQLQLLQPQPSLVAFTAL